MGVLARAELEESPLADLHALASELGIEGYRRLRREELIGAIVKTQGGDGDQAGGAGREASDEASGEEGERSAGRGRRGRGRSGRARRSTREDDETESREDEQGGDEDHEVRTGVLDILPNGSGFVRADAFAHSPDDVYVSPAQIRRCELRTGDEVAGPVRAPRRSERYPSLVRVETVNGGPAEPPAERPSFSVLTPVFARARLTAPEELSGAPFGKGSRVAVAGPPGAGATTLLRRIVSSLAERHSEVETTVVLAGARPEEVAEWRAGVTAPVVGGAFDQSADRQGETATMAVERAKRVAERGGDAVVVVDSLELLPATAARRVFGAARNTEEAGSITVVAATGIGPEPARHATTRIVLRPPGEAEAVEVDADASGTLRAELLS
jgi:transcription termination factor Rho